MDTTAAFSKSVSRWFIGATRLLCVSAMLLCTNSISAFAQSTPRYAIQRGLSVGLGLGLGRTSAPTAGGFSFSHPDLGAGAEFFASRRLAARAGLHSLIPIGGASGSSNSGSTSFDVADHRTQLRLGMRLHPGSSD